jgi:UDP-3-O-[3-hydroxymyristoyl] glucosamine N-acyltransferase
MIVGETKGDFTTASRQRHHDSPLALREGYLKVRELATIIEARWEGDGEREIRRAAALEDAGPDDISFLTEARATTQTETRAGCILVPDGFDNATQRTVIRTKDPRRSMARLIAKLHPKQENVGGVHPSAVLGPGVILAPGVTVGPQAVLGAGVHVDAGSHIGPGCVIGDYVKIGTETMLHSRVTIYANVTIGNRCIIHSGSVIGADGFGFVFADGKFEKFPQIGRVEIGNEVEIGANCTIDRAALGVTSIGDGTKLDNMVHIGHNCRVGRHVVIAAQSGFAGGCVIEDHAVIGGQVGLGERVRVETGAVLASGAGVPSHKIIRSGQTVWGTPARPLKQHLEQLALVAKLPEMKRELDRLREQIGSGERGEP